MKPIFFEPYRPDVCCLCGSSDRLTGEHKIKASVLKAEFPERDMVIGNFSFTPRRGKPVQGPKSKALYFTAGICAKCNGSRTQQADNEFDRFHSPAYRLISQNKDPTTLFQNERYAKGSPPYLNFFRYFAKLLCCHLAQTNAPRPMHLSRFAIGSSNTNCVWVQIDKDWTYQQFEPIIGKHPYAAHRGLVVCGDRRSNSPNGFHSTLTVGALRHTFFSYLTWFERCALRVAHRDFYNFCCDRVPEATISPISVSHKSKLGLAPYEIERDSKN